MERADVFLPDPSEISAGSSLLLASGPPAAPPSLRIIADPSASNLPDLAREGLRAAARADLAVPEPPIPGMRDSTPSFQSGGPESLPGLVGAATHDADAPVSPTQEASWGQERDPAANAGFWLLAEKEEDGAFVRPGLFPPPLLMDEMPTRGWEFITFIPQGDSQRPEDVSLEKTRREGNGAGHASTGKDSEVAAALSGSADGSGIAAILSGADQDAPLALEPLQEAAGDAAAGYAAESLTEPVLGTPFEGSLVGPRAELTSLDQAKPAVIATFQMAGAGSGQPAGTDEDRTEQTLTRFVVGLDCTSAGAPGDRASAARFVPTAEDGSGRPTQNLENGSGQADRDTDRGPSSPTDPPRGGLPLAAPVRPESRGEAKERAQAGAVADLRSGGLIPAYLPAVIGALFAPLLLRCRTQNEGALDPAPHPRARSRQPGSQERT